MGFGRRDYQQPSHYLPECLAQIFKCSRARQQHEPRYAPWIPPSRSRPHEAELKLSPTNGGLPFTYAKRVTPNAKRYRESLTTAAKAFRNLRVRTAIPPCESANTLTVFSPSPVPPSSRWEPAKFPMLLTIDKHIR